MSLKEKICYASGQIGVSLINIAFVFWIMYFYAPPEDEKAMVPLVPVALTGLVIWLGRIVDAITDPLVANFSDKFISRLGRRRPFIFVGAPFLFLIFYLLWIPPNKSGESITNFIYLIIMSGLFWTFFTVASIPYVSLLPEIAVTSNDRISLSTYVAAAMVIGNAIGMIVSSILVGKFDFKIMALVCGFITLICYYITAIFVKERTQVTSEYKELKITKAIVDTFKNRPYLIYLFAFLAFQFGFNILATGIPYITKILLHKPKEAAGMFMGISFGAILLFCPVIMILAKTIGKKRLFSLCMILMAIFFSYIFFIGKISLPFSLTVQTYTLMFIIGFPIAGFFVLQNPILADIIDYDEKYSGLRREGIYYGVQGLIWKVGIGLAAVVCGFLFHSFGYSTEKDLGVRLLGPAAAFFIIIAFIIFQYYPLEEKRGG